MLLQSAITNALCLIMKSIWCSCEVHSTNALPYLFKVSVKHIANIMTQRNQSACFCEVLSLRNDFSHSVNVRSLDFVVVCPEFNRICIRGRQNGKSKIEKLNLPPQRLQ
ncbi:hypothetical protein F8M41_011641 [Gigaspora margarita]|uniref:Secreted protein n=1 Tax=Gigaspora margarita TaxID=4874 RepID=A0A8H3WZZ8_GIGMA|nr:hypothetical protein F8M41_011641 [Gigaspora margarita]